MAITRFAVLANDEMRGLARLHPTLERLTAICEERRQMADQIRLHHWLHGWLFIHLPLSMALLVLTIVHIVMALIRY